MANLGAAGPRSLHDDERGPVAAHDVRVGYFEVDSAGNLTFASPGWCAMMDLQDGAALGDGWLRAVEPRDRDRVEALWRESIAAGSAFEAAYRVVVGGGGKSVRTSVAPVDAADALKGFAGATIDVTDVANAGQALTEAADEFRAIADAIPQLMWMAAADGTIEYVNRPWLEYTGMTLERMRESVVSQVVHPDDLALSWQSWSAALATGDPYEIEYRLRDAKTGAYRWFLGRAIPARNQAGDIVRWIGTATDIDAQKRANTNVRFVLDASSILNANLDVGGVCDAYAQLAIQRVADWCFIVLREGAGYHIAAIAHRDPDRIRLVEKFRDRYPVRKHSPLDAVIRTITPQLIATLGDEQLQAAAQDSEHLQLLRSLEMHSVMLLPLATEDGTVYGGVVLVSSESARTYTVDDLEVSGMVARRAAAAIHTASAFAQERSRAERADFIAEASELLVEFTDRGTTLDRVCEFVVRSMADLAFVMLAENGDALRTVSCAHADAGKAAIADRFRGQRTLRPESEETAIWMLSQHRTLLHKSVPLEAMLSSMWDYLAPDVRALDIRSGITVPLFCGGETYGALIVYRCTPGQEYSEDDAAVFTDLGRRLSFAIDRHRSLERERRIAEALQQALLPQPGMLPKVPGLHFAAHYRPSSDEAQVGGDWYDALSLPDGSIFISVGDVTGRGLHAAGLMGKLRQALAVTSLYERDPARMLDAVDFQLRSRGSSSIATAFAGVIDPERKTLRYAGAGHPAPLLRRNGELLQLHPTGLPVGLRENDRQTSDEVSLEGADLLVLYTDGLIEATRDLAFGEQRLAILASSEAVSFVRNPAEFICDAALPPDAQDDTAVLTVTFGERRAWAFDAENARAAHQARHQLVKYLRERSSGKVDTGAAELVFGELVGNVVRHAPGPIEVQVEWNGEHPVLHVIDRGRGFIPDPGLPVDTLSEGGRGLYIVSKLTRRFHVERIAGYGNHVAAELRL